MYSPKPLCKGVVQRILKEYLGEVLAVFLLGSSVFPKKFRRQCQDAARAAPKCGLVQFGLAAERMEALSKTDQLPYQLAFRCCSHLDPLRYNHPCIRV